MYDLWSDFQNDLLREMRLANTPNKIIARKLGRNENAILYQARTLGLPSRNRQWSPDQDAALKLMWFEEMAIPMIVTLTGRTHDAIVSRARTMGLPRRRARHSGLAVAE